MYNGIQRARRHFRNIFNKQNSTKEASVNKNWEKWRTFFQNWTKSMTWGTFYARGSYEKYILSNAIYLFTNPKGVSFVICQGFSRLIVFGGLSRCLVPSSIGFWNAGEFSWQKSEFTMMTGISLSFSSPKSSGWHMTMIFRLTMYFLEEKVFKGLLIAISA